MKTLNLFVLFMLGIFLVSFISAESGMAVFQNSTTAFIATPQYQTWNETIFGTRFNASAVTGTLQWVVLKNNPIREEMVLGTLDSNSDVKVQFYNPTSNWSAVSTMTASSGVNAYRAFNVEVEQLSGDVMVTYNNGTAGIVGYRVWNGSSWYKSGTVTTNLTGQVNWIKMDSDKNSNKIMLVASDANSDLISIVWNGTSWSASKLLETVLFTATKENFDVAFEDSGDALVIWAETVTTYPKYIVYSNDSWGVEASGPASSGQAAGFQWFRLANYPNTDRIMSCYVDSAADFNCAEWTGSGWGSVYEITAAGEYSNGASFRNFDVVPDTSSQSFFLMYALNNDDYYRTIRCFGQTNCQAGIWEAAQTFLSGVDIGVDTSWAYLTYDPENAGKIVAVMTDQNAGAGSAGNQYYARISCSNSANSCAADQASTLFSVSTNEVYESATFAYFGRKPTIQNISTSATVPTSTLMTISANNVNDSNYNSLNFYCSIASITPTASNTICTGGNKDSVASPYSGINCSYTSQSTDGTYTVYCRVYDSYLYSTSVNTTYAVSSAAPTTSIISVAGDSVVSYFDTANDGSTLINISGESGMECKWAATDLAYSGMSNTCTVSGIYATCNITGISSEGFYTRYVACSNSLGIGQSASQNLDVGFYLDATAPTTSDDSSTDVQLVGYSVTINEGDAVDTDVSTLYCKDTTNTCTPNLAIDNLGQVTFTTRGVNYLRYNSSDDAGNKQAIINKTININQLPTLTSAIDNSTTILGGNSVLISTVSSDADGQNLVLYVCSSSGANASGCTGTQYCANTTGVSSNLTCSFNSEVDSALHIWYAYLFDSLNESATANPLTGSYTTDSTGPVVTITLPVNTTYNTVNLTAEILTSEGAAWAGYSLDGATNVSMTNISSTLFSGSLTSLSYALHNITFFANDSFGNIGTSEVRYFTVSAPADIIAPVLTVVSPANASYTLPSGTYVNVTSDEALSWAGYSLNGGTLTTMSNSSTTVWYVNLTSLSQESTNNLVIYGNDTSNNQGTKTITFYADSLAPRYSSVIANSVNVSQNANCSIFWNDTYSISSVIIGENSTGAFENHTISFSGTSGTASYIIVGSKLTNAGTYTCQFYATDIAGNINSTSTTFTVSDVTAPVITVTSPGNFTYNQKDIELSIVTNENASSAWYSLNGATNVSMGNTTKTNWNYSLTNLSNGAYNIRVYANDSSGNIGSSNLIYFTVNYFADIIAPVLTIINPVNLSYTGSSVSLNISSNEDLSWAGYVLNGGNLTTLSNSSTTFWYTTLSGLSQESTNTLVIYGNDTSNNQGTKTITFYADSLAPRYSSIAANSVNVSQNVNCSIFWNDTFNISSVIIGENSLGSYENHTISFSGTSGTASYIIVGSKLTTAGTYTCQFYATDVAGNSNSTSTTFTVSDVTAPVITVTSPTDGATYNQENILFSIVSDGALSWAGLTMGDGANISLSNSSLTNWYYNFTGLVTGNSYSVTFRGNDSSGNMGVSSTISFSVNTGLADLIPPVLTSTLVNASYKRFAGVAFNIFSNEDLVWAGYTLNGGALTNLTNLSSTLWSETLTGLTSGSTNTLVVYGNDSANNTGTLTLVFYYDNVESVFTNVTANPNPANETQNVVCNAYINDSFTFSSVKISENSTGSFVNHTIDLTSPGNANYTILNLAKGNYECNFYVTDIAGNTNSTSTTFTVNDVTAPVITVTSPTNSTYGDSSIVASIVTNENASSAWYSLDGGANASLTGSTTSWTKTILANSVGSHNIIFYANDSSGNLGVSSLIYFTVAVTDTTPPVLTSTLANASYKTSTSVAFNVSSNENLVWSGYTLNAGSLTNLTSISSTLWSETLTGLTSGSINTLVVYGNDSAGNQGSLQIIFYVDNVASVFTNVTANPNPANETQNVVCNAYIDDSFTFSSVKISENSTGSFVNHTIDLTSPGNANYTILNLAKGNYQCNFYVTDIAGNSNSTSTTFAVNDVTAPVITINSPLNSSSSTSSILFSITTNENASAAWYSLDAGATNLSLTGSAVSWSNTSTLTDAGYTVIFYANDTSGNLGRANVTFTVDVSVNDISSPIITIISPLNGSYDIDGTVLLNISTDENLAWAGYKNNSGTLTDLGNVSLKDGNKTITLAEGTQFITFYANDTSSNKNQGTRNVTLYVDLNNPAVNSFACNSSINDSANLSCSSSLSDAIGLDYAILSYDFNGTFVNSSEIDLTGTSDSFNYLFTQGNYTPGSYSVLIYTFDLSGRINGSESESITVLDDTAPVINNFSYSPRDELDLDPGVTIEVNSSVSEDYSIGSVYLMYKNDSTWTYVLMQNTTLTDYNASFVSPAGNVTIKINATDVQGNVNISSPVSFNSSLDTSQNVTTTIDSIESITYAQRSAANNLGEIVLENTGDTNLTFNVTVSAASNILGRFDLNSSTTVSQEYNVSTGDSSSLDLFVNTTELTSGLYLFTITVTSEAGIEVFTKYLNIQTSAGAYLVVSIDEYSSYVTRGQTGIDMVVSVTNLGTVDASGVTLYWTLPSGVNLTSGTLSRYIGALPIGVVAQNSITFSVDSNISLSNLTFTASANDSLADIVSDSKLITVLDPIVINNTVVVTTPGAGGGGGGGGLGGGGGAKVLNYSNLIEILRGQTDTFEIKVKNPYVNTTLTNLNLVLTGFLEQYISFSPTAIYNLDYSKEGSFVVKVKSPKYKSYEEYDLKAVISGDLVGAAGISDYRETQYIKLIIQDMSYNESAKKVLEAEKAIEEMKQKQFYVKDVSAILNITKDKLASHRNREAYDLAVSIIAIRDKAFSVYDLINRIYTALQNPRKANLLTGNVVFEAQNDSSFVMSFLGKKYLFASNSVEELLGMAVVAFERGDYNLAEERAKSAEMLLVLERKGNVGLFLYLYWEVLLVGIIIFLAIAIISYKFFRKNRISAQIVALDDAEQQTHKLMIKLQNLYFAGNISNAEYNRTLAGYNHELARIKDKRVALRNARVKLLKFSEIAGDLDRERKDIENRIKFMQKEFYVNKKMSKSQYDEEFSHANEILAEIEEEKATLDLINKHKSNKESSVKEKVRK